MWPSNNSRRRPPWPNTSWLATRNQFSCGSSKRASFARRYVALAPRRSRPRSSNSLIGTNRSSACATSRPTAMVTVAPAPGVMSRSTSTGVGIGACGCALAARAHNSETASQAMRLDTPLVIPSREESVVESPGSHPYAPMANRLKHFFPGGQSIMRRFISALAIATLCASGSVAFAQGAKEETKKAGEATKEAGKDTADAAKHIGKATAKGTKKAAKATKNAVQHTYACVDGTTDEATLKANACKEHGGVKVEAKVNR